MNAQAFSFIIVGSCMVFKWRASRGFLFISVCNPLYKYIMFKSLNLYTVFYVRCGCYSLVPGRGDLSVILFSRPPEIVP